MKIITKDNRKDTIVYFDNTPVIHIKTEKPGWQNETGSCPGGYYIESFRNIMGISGIRITPKLQKPGSYDYCVFSSNILELSLSGKLKMTKNTGTSRTYELSTKN